MGFHDGANWKTYLDSNGNFALVGSGTHGLSWNAGTGVLTIAGSMTILGGSGYGNLTDKPTSLSGINSTEGSKLTGIEAGADVTSTHTAYDTARVDGTAASTVKTNASTALANAATAQSTADNAATAASNAQTSANTANNLLADIAADNKFTPAEKQATKKEWDVIVSEKTKNDDQADAFSVSKTAYGNAYTSLSGYITPMLANLATTDTIVGTDFRANFKAYYDARTDLLNAIAAKAKTLADTAQATATNAGAAAAAAQTTANNAATAASNAQTSANTANNLLADIAADNKFTPAEKQATKKEWDVIVSEKTKNDDQADAFSVSKTAYGNAYTSLSGYITPMLANLATTDTIVGTDFRANFKAYYDARTDLLNAIAAKAKTLADTAQATATNAGAAAAAAQTTANNAATAASNAQTSANTANSLLANIADDNKFTPVEKQAARKEWEIIAAEKTLNNAQAFEFVGFSAGITEAGYGESAKNAYWTTCWNKLNDLIDETNAVPGFAVQTYSDFVAEESGYYDTELDVIYDLPISAPALLSVVDANNAYNVAFQTLATYLNDGMTYSSGVPFWLADANLGETWPIVGATFRATWKAYYDARTTLLNSIAARAKALADAAQAAAGIGAEHAATAHAPSDADHTQTTIDGGLVTTGTLQVVQGGTVAAGITGNTAGDTAVRFFAGSTFANRASAPFRVLQNGAIYATSATISGTITSGSGSQIAGFTATTTDLTAGSGTSAIGISTDTAKKAFWAGNATPASAPFYVDHAGFVFSKSGSMGGFTIAEYTLSVSSSAGGGYAGAVELDSYNERMGSRWAFYSDANNNGSAYQAITVNGFICDFNVTSSGVGCHNVVKVRASRGDTTGNAPIEVNMNASTNYAFWTDACIYAGGGFYPTSDENVKSDINDVSVLTPLRTLRVKKYRLDDKKIKKLAREKAIEKALRENKPIPIEAETTQESDLPDYNPNLSIGVMAADFNAAFGIGRGDKTTYNLTDAIGVALRAIQELAEIVDDQAAEIAKLNSKIEKHQEAIN
jgi:hypothetical protein